MIYLLKLNFLAYARTKEIINKYTISQAMEDQTAEAPLSSVFVMSLL